MKKFITAAEFCFFLIFGSLLKAQEPDSASDLRSLVEAERAFAKMAVTNGVRDAFVVNFSDDAIIFRPGPVKGRPVWQQRKSFPYMIRWEPEYVDIAASGDFGYSTGPADYFDVKPLSAPIGFGYFISIWAKQPDGKWKVVFDVGTEVPQSKNREVKIHFPPGADVKKAYSPINAETEKNALIRLDEGFSAAFEKARSIETYLNQTAKSARFYREGRFPTSDADSVRSILMQNLSMSWKPEGGGTANSGDLGYTYGTYRIKGASGNEEGFYFRIWKKENKQNWKIVIDKLSPTAPKK